MNSDLRAAYRVLLQLEKSKSLSDQLIDSLPGVYVIIDLSGRIYRANDDAAIAAGFTPDEILGKDVAVLFGKRTLEFLAHLASYASGVQREEFEMPIHTRSGPVRDFHWEIKRVPIDSKSTGELYNVIGKDVSEFKRTLRSLAAAEHDLELAHSVQSMLLAENNSERSDRWSMAAYYEPAAVTGGDWWRHEVRADGSALFLLGDVTGHGVGAAMVTALVTGCFETFIEHRGSHDVPGLFQAINSRLSSLRGRSHWMTLLAVDIHPNCEYFEWFSAAAPAGVVVNAGGKIEEFGGESLPLGAGELSVASGKMNFQPGDRIFCTTDGLLEISPTVSEKRLRHCYNKILTQEIGKPEVAREKVLLEQSKWLKDVRFKDDVAFIIIDHLKDQLNPGMEL